MSPLPVPAPTLIIMALLVALVVLVSISARRLRARRSALTQLAATHDLNLRTGPRGQTFLLNGRFLEHTVFVQAEWETTADTRTLRTRLVVDVGVRLPPGMQVSREGGVDVLRKAMGEPDVQLGERRLDDALLVQGPERQVQILLKDGPLRAALLRWTARYPAGRVEDDQVIVDLPPSIDGGLQAVMVDAVRMAGALSAAVRRLSEPAPDDDLGKDAVGVRARLPVGVPEGTLARWRVEPGDTVTRGQPLCDVLTSVGTRTIDAPAPGVLTRCIGGPGRPVRAGDLIAALRPDPGVTVPAQPLPPNPSGLELIDLDLVDLHPQDLSGAARGPRLDADSPRPPGVPSRQPARPEPSDDLAVEAYDPARHTDLDPAPAPDPGDRPTDPTGVTAPELGNPSALTALLAKVPIAADSAAHREAWLAEHAQTVWCFDVQVNDVRWTVGLSLPDRLQRGRTATGRVVGAGVEIAVRFPDSRNGELDTLGRAPAPRAPLTVVARLAAWDPMYRRAVFHAR